MYEEIKQQIIDVSCQFIAERIIYDTAGNISVRIPQTNHIILTPTNIPYDCMKPSELPVLDLQGKVVEEGLKPTSETPIHLAVMRAFPEIHAVIHTHSMYASAFSINRKPIEKIYLLSMMIGYVPVAEYGTPGSQDLGEKVVKALEENQARCVLLANHGALITAKNLELAKNLARYLERTAELQHIAMSHGKTFSIPDEDIKAYQEEFIL